MADRFDKKITDLERRVSNSVVIGTVSKVDHAKGRYRVKAGELESDWLPMASPRAGKTSQYSSFEQGEQVIIASPSGDLSQGVILAAIATAETQAADKGTVHRIKYPDGTTVDYDHESHDYTMKVAAGGAFNLSIGGGASISASGDGMSIKAAKLTIDADVQINGSSLMHNAKNVGDTHEHTGVMPGASLTGPPA